MCRWYKKNKIPIIKLYDSRAIHDYKRGSSKKNLLTSCIVEKHFMKSTFIYSGISKNEIFSFLEINPIILEEGVYKKLTKFSVEYKSS